VHVGTHSVQVEIGLRHLFGDVLRWVCIDDHPCGGTSETPWGPVVFQDGVLGWRNPRLSSTTAVCFPSTAASSRRPAEELPSSTRQRTDGTKSCERDQLELQMSFLAGRNMLGVIRGGLILTG
jgi:hypothetical protein